MTNTKPEWEELFKEFWRLVDEADSDKMEDFLKETVEKAERRGAERAVELVKKYWTFDEDQQHTHSWHDRADFLEAAKKVTDESMTPRTDNNADHPFVARLNPSGTREWHSCVSPEHGGILVCDTCGKDYHEFQKEHEACPLKK